jgi:hypothetical protein
LGLTKKAVSGFFPGHGRAEYFQGHVSAGGNLSGQINGSHTPGTDATDNLKIINFFTGLGYQHKLTV